MHDPELLDRLADLPTESFQGLVYRATRLNLDPLVTSSYGGRWGTVGGPSMLYTSLSREGALAEVSYHWAQQTPRPSKPLVLHRLRIGAPRTLRFLRASLEALGVDMKSYAVPNLPSTQAIGAAVEFLGYDGLIAPSARWPCDNLILCPETASFGGTIAAFLSEYVEWLGWARPNGLVTD